MKKILLTIYRFGKFYGGAERDTYEWVKYMRKFFDIKILTKEIDESVGITSENLKILNSNLVKIFSNIRLNLKGVGRIKWMLSLLEDYIKIKKESRDVDVFYGIYFGKDLFFTLATFLVSYSLKKPFILNPYTHLIPYWESPLNRFLYEESDIIIARTKSEKEWLSRFTNANKIKIFTPIISLPCFKNLNSKSIRKKYNISGPIVLFIGRKNNYKGYKLILDSANLVWEELPECVFIFAGKDDEESKRIFDKFKDKRIKNLGYVREEEKFSLFKECDIFCMPSQQESFGIVYAEAWYFRKPVIALNIKPLNEIISHKVDGILVNNNPASVASAIKMLLKNEKMRKELGNNGYKKLFSKFLPNVERWYNLIYKITFKKYKTKRIGKLIKIILWK